MCGVSLSRQPMAYGVREKLIRAGFKNRHLRSDGAARPRQKKLFAAKSCAVITTRATATDGPPYWMRAKIIFPSRGAVAKACLPPAPRSASLMSISLLLGVIRRQPVPSSSDGSSRFRNKLLRAGQQAFSRGMQEAATRRRIYLHHSPRRPEKLGGLEIRQ